MGIESGRLHFSWISSAEAGKFVDLVKEITDQVMQLGPAQKLIKELPLVDEYLAGSEQVAARSQKSELRRQSTAGGDEL
jgi:hypothetical protein